MGNQTHRKLSRSPEYRKLFEACIAQGWTVEQANGGHIKVISPTGKPFFSSSSPSDHRSVLNFRALLRREGLVV